MKETKLNRQQKQAVEHRNGPALIVAGAGTGKTKVIIDRLAYLVSSGVPKNQILCLTFTEKAAQEMLDRASEALNESYGVELNIYTFNGFGSEILREFAVEIGLNKNLKLVGDNGKVVLLREHLDSLGLDYFAPISRPEGQLANIADYFSKLKQQIITPEKYIDFVSKMPKSSQEEKLEKTRHSELSNAYKKYLEICRGQNIIDYDDQIYLLIDLLIRRPNVLEILNNRYKYIMVDEFQDTNPMQSKLIDLLAGKDKNLLVVGDDDQSIYGWRGATLANILDFSKNYKNSKQVTLTQNYRSTQKILDQAYQLIQNNNPNRLEIINNLDKKLLSTKGTGMVPSLHKFSRLDYELNWVAEDIKHRIEKGTNPGDIAVLARRKNTVSKIHNALDIKNVEHIVSGVSSSLYKNPLVASLIEVLRAITQHNNSNALYHTLVGPLFELDPQTLGRIASEARSNHENLEDSLKNHEDVVIKNALELIESWRELAGIKLVTSMVYTIIDSSGYKVKLYKEASTDQEYAYLTQVLGQWFYSLRDFEQVATMPTAFSYLENLPALEAEDETISDDQINLSLNLPVVMTAHKAKGLEWSIVYIVDLTQGSFPLTNNRSSLNLPTELSLISAADDQRAEERRLMYVATTRAKDELILTYSDSHTGVTTRKPSQFIEEFFDKNYAANSSGETNTLPLFEENTRVNEVKLPAKMYSGKNLHLTASQADDYLSCPLNFYYKHVLNVPEPPSANTKIGSLFHEFLEEINTAKKSGSPMPSLEPMLNKLNEEWPKVGFSSKIQRERAYNFSKNALANMHERMEMDAIIPLQIESPFRVQVPSSNLIISGRIDVILPIEGGIEIRDYKTSSGVSTPEKAKSRVSSNNQLTIYSVALRHTIDEDAVQVSLDFVQTGQIGTLKKRSKSLDTMEAKLAKAAEDIIAGNFLPGNNHDFCIHPFID